MKLFDVYPLFEVEPSKAQGAYLWDQSGQKYLDLYGGHAVISIGHNHPHFVDRLKTQLDQISFYSNSVKNALQIELAQLLGKLSGYEVYQLFLCSSGAEANENALKLASFHTQKKKIIAFEKGFHGRTSAAVAATDNPKIVAPLNANHDILRLPWQDEHALEEALRHKDVAAVIIEGIQGVGGVHIPTPAFLERIQQLCRDSEALLILDEVQSGYGRSGHFFAHQSAQIQPDLITVAKGMGNGFPIGGVLIHPEIKPWYGMLGTTFGGNHLACAAGLAVLEVIQEENLIAHTRVIGQALLEALKSFSTIKEVRGMGLMIGMEFDYEIKALREQLLMKHHIFTGASGKHTLRLLPPLNLTQEQVEIFLEALRTALS